MAPITYRLTPIGFFYFLLISSLASLGSWASAASLHLEPSTATCLQRREDGAAFITKAPKPEEQVLWQLAQPLQPGLYKVRAQFSVKGERAKDVELCLDANGPIPVNFRRVWPGESSPEVATYFRTPATRVYFKKSVGPGTIAVTSVTFDLISEKELGALPITLPLDVRNGIAQPPFALPPGNYHAGIAGSATIGWHLANGKFETPAPKNAWVWLDSDLQQLSLSNVSINKLSLERLPSAKMPNMKVPNGGPLMKTIDEQKIESGTLLLPGYQGNEPVTLAQFPEGKTAALFTMWDDGRMNDFEVAKLLQKYGIRATMELNSFSEIIPQIHQLEALGMEIGSHSWSHPIYSQQSPQRCLAESVENRRLLESLVGHPVISFAYPKFYTPAYDAKGDYVLRSVQEAGYWSARGVGHASNTLSSFKQLPLFDCDFHWAAGADAIGARFEQLKTKPGCVFAFWGHSYEVTGPENTAKLEEILKRVAGKADVWYTTQGELFVWRWMRGAFKIQKQGGKEGVYTVTHPWAHPWLRRVPLTLKVPRGAASVSWNGKQYPVADGLVTVPW